MSNQSTSWTSRPVFISSTFRDMQRERDWLNSRVFPRIREELAKRRHHLEPIDLRLGVETAEASTEEARELLVLKVCLDEIKRSRPFLLVILGDRYGWVPPKERIEAAAREQGFETSPAGKSVTALEIEFGILKEDPTQKHRSLFFFRKPLPYDRMPEAADYSDAHSPDPQVREGHAKLVALKDKLSRDPELAGRVHEYSAGWDPQTREVTGLEAFGDLVFEKLWAVIDEETKDWASQPAPTWEEQERAAIAEFVEHRSRGFVGRGETIETLLGIARSPAVEGPPGSTTWGACVTGSPGSGKSAVFAKILRELENNPSFLLLANAAGGTGRGASIDSMLRRWIGELASAAKVADPLPANASNDDIEAAFYSLLGRVAAQRRVVVLLDALDQSEPTPRGKHLTWFKAQAWPPNARIVATAIPCPASDVLSERAGIEEIELPPLTPADAEAIGKHIWGRYHRALNPTVLAVLVGKKLPDGQPACGNPLWLTLALEQLNLLDADDFARAERDFTGSPTERMAALLLDTARRMPPDITGLYGWLLDQNEKTFGVAETRAFATAIALSHTGWRDADLLALVPAIAKCGMRNAEWNPSTTEQTSNSEFQIPNFSDLSLASIRRAFRAHIVRRGENGQIDFFHAQMRRTVIERCAPEEPARRARHAAISDYLETLPASDPMIRFERMHQLIGQQDAARAASYYATIDASGASTTERLGSTWTLVDWIAEAESTERDNPNLSWIASWLTAPGLTNDQVSRLINNFQFGLFERLENDVVLPTRQRLVEATRSALQSLADEEPSNARWQRNLSVSQTRIGDVLRAQGDLEGALKAYRKSLSVTARLAGSNPSNALWQLDLSQSQDRIGDMLHAQGDLDGALKAYTECMAITSRLATANSSYAVPQRSGLSSSHSKIGNLLQEQGDLAGALKAYIESLAIAERLASASPSDAYRQGRLSWSQIQIGNVLHEQGDLSGALKAYKESHTIIARLAALDPSDAKWQSALTGSQIQIGNVLYEQGDLVGALKAFRESHTIIARLAALDPSDANKQSGLSTSHSKIGNVLVAQGDLAGALKAYRESLAISERLAALSPSAVGEQGSLSARHQQIANVLLAQGDLAGALLHANTALEIATLLSASYPENPKFQFCVAQAKAAIFKIRMSRPLIRVALLGATGLLLFVGWKLLQLNLWFLFVSLPLFLLAFLVALPLIGPLIAKTLSISRYQGRLRAASIQMLKASNLTHRDNCGESGAYGFTLKWRHRQRSPMKRTRKPRLSRRNAGL